MTEQLFEVGDVVENGRGNKLRVLSLDGNISWPIVCVDLDDNGYTTSYSIEGKSREATSQKHLGNLIPPKRTVTSYIVVFPSKVSVGIGADCYLPNPHKEEAEARALKAGGFVVSVEIPNSWLK